MARDRWRGDPWHIDAPADRALIDELERRWPALRDTVAAMIEANRTIYREKDKVVPIMVEATQKPKAAVEFAWESNTKNCVWSVNTGFDPKLTQWSIDNSVENGDIPKEKKPAVEQVANLALAKEAVEAAVVGGVVRARRGWKVRRGSAARDVGAAARVDSDRGARVR